MTYSIRIEKSKPMEMREGTILRADIFRPDDNEKHPAILTRTPYNRQMAFDFNAAFLPYWDAVAAGYAIIIQSLRGCFDSGGQSGLGDVTLAGESADGYDSVEWIAAQPWCDGNVGTCGGSYMGLLQWITGRSNPPHLKAMAPWVSGSGGEEPSRHNGISNLGVALNWLLNMTVEAINKQEKEGKDVSKARKMLEQANASPDLVYNYLPLKDVPYFNFPGIKEMWANRILNSDRDTPEFFEKTKTPYEKIMVPCMHIAGWYDFYPSGTLGHFNAMREMGGSKLARENQYIVMGPWIHPGPSAHGDTGALGFGMLASLLGSQLGENSIAFFDKYLRGKKVNLPHVRYFTMGKNIWQTADTWPPHGVKFQRYFLHSSGRANSIAFDGFLNRDEPGAELVDNFVYNPHFPVLTNGCRGHLQLVRFTPGPQEQASTEKRDDVVCYTSAELKEDIEVTGPLLLHLFASSSARDTDFTAKLVDVYPDGRAYNVVCDGITRARYRKSLYKPELLTPGEINEYVINLEAVSQLFCRGHRIRIDVASSSFPEYERNMNTGNAVGEDAVGVPALQTIYHQKEYMSYIDLPVMGK
jgi:uncharacterized protein